MALVTQAAALCVIAALLGLVLRRSNPEITLLLALAEPLTELLRFLERLAEQSGVSRTLLTPLYKTVGIALVVKVGGGLCRDAGESALAAALEFAGTVCALLTASPDMAGNPFPAPDSLSRIHQPMVCSCLQKLVLRCRRALAKFILTQAALSVNR